MGGPGTKTVFEDDRVIVWHLDLEPGEQGSRHTHELGFVDRILMGSTLQVFGPDGESLATVDAEAGSLHAFRVIDGKIVSDDPGLPAVPATHSTRNVGVQSFKGVVVEFKN